MEVLKVSSKSNPNSVAGALAGIVREQGAVEVQTVGAGALNQAIKAIAIARGLIREPELLILDDSLSAVDAKSEQVIIQNIQDIRQGQTTIIITHRLSAVAKAHKVIVMDQGKIAEYGTPEQLLQQKGWYYQQHLKQQLEEDQHENI